MVEEEATTTLLEQENERRGLTTWANMVRSREFGGELCALEVLCEVLVLRVHDDDDDYELTLLSNNIHIYVYIYIYIYIYINCLDKMGRFK